MEPVKGGPPDTERAERQSSEPHPPENLRDEPPCDQSGAGLLRGVTRLDGLIILLKILFLTVLAYLNPFGIVEASDQESEDVIRRIAAPLMESVAGDQILVVLYTDTDLRLWGEPWPVSYGRQAHQLRSLLELKPKAVFLDFLFTHQHSNDRSLEDFTRSIRRGVDKGIPIFVGGIGTASPDDGAFKYGILRPVAEAASGVSMLAGARARYYSLVFDPCASEDDSPKKSRVCARTQLAEMSALTPAWMLYEAASRPTSRPGSRPGDSRLSPLQHPDMLPIWSLGASAQWLDVVPSMGEICPPSAQGGGNRLRQAFDHFWQGLVGGARRLDVCFYPPTIEARFLSEWRDDPDYRAKLRALVQDRIVIVGGWVDGIPDLVVSPLHGTVPGALLHATALDNLLSLGDRYFVKPPGLVGESGWDDLLELLLVALLLLKSVRVEKICSGVLSCSPVVNPGPRSSWRFWLRQRWLILALLIVLQVVLAGLERQALGLQTLVLAMTVLLHAVDTPRLGIMVLPLSRCFQGRGMVFGIFLLVLGVALLSLCAWLLVLVFSGWGYGSSVGGDVGQLSLLVFGLGFVLFAYGPGSRPPAADNEGELSYLRVSMLAQTLILSIYVLSLFSLVWRFAPLNWMAILLLGLAIFSPGEDLHRWLSSFFQSKTNLYSSRRGE